MPNEFGNILAKIVKDRREDELKKLNAVKVVNELFESLMERERDILSRRFALHGKDYETLEEIGQLHKLTRERVRQIEASSIKKIKKLENLESYLVTIKGAVSELLASHGGIMEKDLMLDVLAMACIMGNAEGENDRELYKKYFEFVINKLLEEEVELVEKSKNFNSFYKAKEQTVSHLEELAEELNDKISKLKKTVNLEELLSLVNELNAYNKHKEKLMPNLDVDMTGIYKNEIFPEKGETINANKVLYSLIQANKNVDRNKFGAWGMKDWAEISPKKMGDKIYLILKNSGQPMHFTEIADKINEVAFDHKKANLGTIHNELILDDRYVLLDRGVYGLKEWQLTK